VLHILKAPLRALHPPGRVPGLRLPSRGRDQGGGAALPNSGRERTSVIAYALGWTQHSNRSAE